MFDGLFTDESAGRNLPSPRRAVNNHGRPHHRLLVDNLWLLVDHLRLLLHECGLLNRRLLNISSGGGHRLLVHHAWLLVHNLSWVGVHLV